MKDEINFIRFEWVQSLADSGALGFLKAVGGIVKQGHPGGPDDGMSLELNFMRMASDRHVSGAGSFGLIPLSSLKALERAGVNVPAVRSNLVQLAGEAIAREGYSTITDHYQLRDRAIRPEGRSKMDADFRRRDEIAYSFASLIYVFELWLEERLGIKNKLGEGLIPFDTRTVFQNTADGLLYPIDSRDWYYNDYGIGKLNMLDEDNVRRVITDFFDEFDLSLPPMFARGLLKTLDQTSITAPDREIVVDMPNTGAP